MTKRELYRFVFKSPEGEQVFADLARHVRTINYEKPGSAGALFAYIAEMINSPDPPVNGGARPIPRASGGRIEHG